MRILFTNAQIIKAIYVCTVGKKLLLHGAYSCYTNGTALLVRFPCNEDFS